MTWGMILSGLTIALSLLTEKDLKTKEGRAAPSTSSSLLISNPLGRNLTRSDQQFLAGALLGSGLSFLVISLSRHFRFSQRLKRLWLDLWTDPGSRPIHRPEPLTPPPVPNECNSDHSDKINGGRGANKTSDNKTATPSDYLLNNQHGSIRLLVSPKTAATYHFSVTVITLEPGREIPSLASSYVEFYYVLSGSGSFSQQGIVETSKIVKNDCFVVEPGQTRWISNRKSTEPLILLRASDGDMSNCSDVIRLDPQERQRSSFQQIGMEAVMDKFRSVEGFLKERMGSGSFLSS